MAKEMASGDDAAAAAEAEARRKIEEQKFWEAARGQQKKKSGRLVVIVVGAVLGIGVAGGAVFYGPQILAPAKPPTPAAAPAAAAAPREPQGPQPISGPARAADGGTLTVGGRTIRLQGVAAPPLSLVCRSASTEYRCGEVARKVLEYFAGETPVACTPGPGSTAAAAVAVCRNQKGFDIASLQVEAGWAIIAGAQGSLYAAEQARAQAKEAGLWRGDFARPDVWKAAAR
jgi:endonuclease YncB( thermonuclease family)